MDREVETHNYLNGKVWLHIPLVSNKSHGVVKSWSENGRIVWLDIHRHGLMLMEIHLSVNRKDVPANKTLFNKSQWKILCYK